MKLYTTLPSILTLVTWVPQNRQGKLHPSLRGCSAPPPFKWGRQLSWLGYRRIGRGSATPHSAVALHPLCSTGKHSTKVNRAFCPARSFSLVNPRGRQLKAQLYSSELSYRAVVIHISSSKKKLYYEIFVRGVGGLVSPLLGQSRSLIYGEILRTFHLDPWIVRRIAPSSARISVLCPDD